jgi:membrane-bound metal-dependent hydrolase YbcI (DUF457 family)
MANRAEHEFWGAIAGGTVATFNKDASKWVANPVTGAFIGQIAGRLPDILEPATSPNHRSFFHSWLFLGILGFGLFITYKWKPQSKWEKAFRLFILIIGGAYVSHLALDSLTKRSLPIA